MIRAFTLLLVLCLSISVPAQQLISTEYKSSFTHQEMIDLFGPFAQNGVDLYKITYTTPDIESVLDTASGLVMIPIRDEQLAYPLLCYQHGSGDGPQDVPSNLMGDYEAGLAFAALGYVVSAADYLGLGEARGFHPYLHAETEASAAIDMLFAVQEMAPQIGFYLNDQLFISGYSQGGHAAMATHRALQENYSDDFTVTASAPLSGPYLLTTTFTQFILGEETYPYPCYIAFAILSFDMVYGLYDEMEQYFKLPYVPILQQFRDGTFGPLWANDLLIDQLVADVGAPIPRYMFQDSVLNHMTSNPDHPLNRALAANNVHDWAPDAPTRLFYCMADEQAPFSNSVTADSVMTMNGAPDVAAFDINPNLGHYDCAEPAITAAILFFSSYQQLEVVGVQAIADFESPTVYPNPASGQFWVENIPANAWLELINANGQVVHQQWARSDREVVAVATLPPGLYVLRVRSEEGGFRTVKVVVQ
jgi:hypothetical protein